MSDGTVHMVKSLHGIRTALCVIPTAPCDYTLTDHFQDITCATCLQWVDWLSACFGPV